MTQTLDVIKNIGVNDGGAVETVVGTSKPCSSSPVRGVNPVVRISGLVSITPGAAATGVVIRVRQNDAAGGLFGTYAVPVTAGVTTAIPFYILDNSGISEQGAGVVYAITVTETAATAPGLLSLAAAIEVLT